MAIPSKPTYTHGSQGTEPGSSLDYQNGDPLDADNFDYYVNVEFSKIKAIIDALNTLDSNDDGKVDAADVADNTTLYKGNDIDSDGDGVVNDADYAAQAGDADTVDNHHADAFHQEGEEAVDFIVENRTTDPSSPAVGREWVRTDL